MAGNHSYERLSEKEAAGAWDSVLKSSLSVRLPANYCQKQPHSLGFRPCCMLMLPWTGTGNEFRMLNRHKMSSCRTSMSCQLSSTNLPSTTQGQTSHLCKGSCGAAPAQRGASGRLSCTGKQKLIKRKDGERREYPQMSEVQHSCLNWCFSHAWS